jgi:putative photosynthetic complex assembly protein
MSMITATRPVLIFPRGSGPAVAGALLLTMLAIGGARITGYQPEKTLPQQAALQTRVLQFEDSDQGRVLVRDAATHMLIKEYASGEGAFIRATIRALVNDRKRRGVTATGDFRLEAHEGKQLFLIDEASGKTISLNAFGPDNAAAFAAFM